LHRIWSYLKRRKQSSSFANDVTDHKTEKWADWWKENGDEFKNHLTILLLKRIEKGFPNFVIDTKRVRKSTFEDGYRVAFEDIEDLYDECLKEMDLKKQKEELRKKEEEKKEKSKLRKNLI
jgi:hypothetical protein